MQLFLWQCQLESTKPIQVLCFCQIKGLACKGTITWGVGFLWRWRAESEEQRLNKCNWNTELYNAIDTETVFNCGLVTSGRYQIWLIRSVSAKTTIRRIGSVHPWSLFDSYEKELKRFFEKPLHYELMNYVWYFQELCSSSKNSSEMFICGYIISRSTVNTL